MDVETDRKTDPLKEMRGGIEKYTFFTFYEYGLYMYELHDTTS